MPKLQWHLFFDLGKKSMGRFLDGHKENLQICLALHEVTIKT